VPRPRTRDGLPRVLDAAESYFRDFGVRDAAIADIARRAGVGPATIYRLVKDKDTLFQLTLMRAWDPSAVLPSDYPIGSFPDFEKRLHAFFDIEAHLPILHATAAGRADDLRAVIEEHYDFQVGQARWLDLVEAATTDDENTERVWFQGIIAPLVDLTAASLQHLEAAGQVARGWPHVPTAWFIMLTCTFFARTGVELYPQIDADARRRRERAVRRVQRALRVSPTSEALNEETRHRTRSVLRSVADLQTANRLPTIAQSPRAMTSFITSFVPP